MSKCRFCDHSNPDDAQRCEGCGVWLTDRQSEPAPDHTPADQSDTAPDELESRLLEILRAGRKIEAVKLCRQETGLGLKEAKDAVEELARKHEVQLPKGGGCAGVLLLAVAMGAAVAIFCGKL